MEQEKNSIHRPSWDEYFLLLAFNVSLRSDDQFIKHGAVIVDNLSKHIIGTGYNGTIRGFSDTELLFKRDERRPYMIHAEENAILNCWKNPLELKDRASLYVTGLPCVNCLQRIINFGIKRIVMAKRQGSITENKESQDMRNKILQMSKINIKQISIDNNHWFENFLPKNLS